MHLRRRALQHRDHQEHARRLHRHAALRRGLAAARGLPPRSTAASTRWARAARGRRSRWSSPPSRRTSCWPASARPSQVLVQDSQNRKLDRHLFNEAYLMHTSTSPQYAIIASLRRRGGDDGAARRHRAGGGEHPRSARLPPRDAQGRRASTARTGGSRSGARTSWSTRASAAPTTGSSRARHDAKWHGFGNLAEGFNLLDPIKSHHRHARAST